MSGPPIRRNLATRSLFLLLLLAVQACGVLPQTGPPGENLHYSRRTN